LRSLYLRVWLTVVAVLAAFALGSGWLWQRHVEGERVRIEAQAGERVAAWGELTRRCCPTPATSCARRWRGSRWRWR